MKLFYTFILVLVVFATGLSASSKEVTVTREQFDNMSSDEITNFIKKHGNFRVVPDKAGLGINVNNTETKPVPVVVKNDDAELETLRQTNKRLQESLICLQEEVSLARRQKEEREMALRTLEEQVNNLGNQQNEMMNLLLNNNSPEKLSEEPVVEEGSPLPVTVITEPKVPNYQINTRGNPELRVVELSKDIVTVYERGRPVNIVSSASPWSVTIVGDLPEQEGKVNGEDPVGQLLPGDIEQPSTPAPQEDPDLIVGAY